MSQQSLPGADAPDPGRICCPRDFGRELTLARRRAGRTVREVARTSGIPASTAGDYFAGRHLPPARQPDVLPRILAACAITDTGLVDRWLDALARVRTAPGRRPASGPAPYRGLASFQPEDAAWFFGREELALHLVRLATGPGAPGLPLAVVGPSGSGKSSLLRAGLIPRLRAGTPARPGGRPVVLLTPGAAPVEALAGALAPLLWPGSEGPLRAGLLAQGFRDNPERQARLAGRGDEPPGVIVDQLEEIFTAGATEAGRREFVAALSALSEHTLVVLGLRADFYGHALDYPGLARSLQERQIVVGPMSAGQLRRAIVEPAHKAGAGIDDGLVEVLLSDYRPQGGAGPAAGGDSAGVGLAERGRAGSAGAGKAEPGGATSGAGALPLLSHALLATWEHSRGGRLTVSDYRASGGIRDAIARTAEQAYAGLGADAQEIARRLFLRLVNVGDDGRETRARVPLGDLPAAAAAAAAVLERFVGQRLVTLDQDAAEITHEALLGAWPRLRAWIDADREDLRVRRFITTAAQAWARAGRETAALLRGGQLALARDWAASEPNRAALSQLSLDFVAAGVAEERAAQAAGRRRTRRLRQLVAALTALVLLTVGLAGYAFRQRQAATAAETQAQSRTLAIEASQIRANDPGVAAQLALAGYQIAPTSQALSSLLESSGAPMAARMDDSEGVVQSVALAGDRRLLAVAAADGTLKLWDLARPGHPTPAGTVVNLGRARPLYAAAFGPGGRVLAAAGADGKARLWDVADPRHPVPLGAPLTGPGSTIYSLAFSPGGSLLAAGSADDTVRLWDVADPAHPVPVSGPLRGAAGPVRAVAFSPDGRLLAAGSADQTVRLWDVASPAGPRLIGRPLTGPAGAVDAVAFSPDGTRLAAGSYDDRVWVWDVADPARPGPAARFTGATDWVMAVAFSPGGTMLAAGGSDGRVLVWDTATGALVSAFPHPQPVTSLAWAGPGLLISGDADGYARAWRVPAPGLVTGSPVNSIAYSRDGTALAAGAADLELWSLRTRTLTASVAIPGAPAGTIVNAVAFSPAGTLIATGYSDGRIQLWRTGTSRHAATLVPLGPPVTASATGLVEFVAFSPGGTVLASGGDDGTVRLWNLTDPARPAPLSVIRDSGTYVFSVAFSPRGHLLAAASADHLTRLWDITDPAHPVPAVRGKPLGGPDDTAYSVAFSPDGRTLAVGSADSSVRLWDLTHPARPRRTGPVLTGPSGYVYSVAFSPDGHTLAAGNTDGSVWLWNVADRGRPWPAATLTGPARHVYSVAFAPDGHTLAAADSAGLVWLWDTHARDAAATVCATSGQPLTPAEWHAYVPGRPYAPPCPG